jgi:hypothetical protein
MHSCIACVFLMLFLTLCVSVKILNIEILPIMKGKIQMFKIIIAVLFCCYECMASNDDRFFTEELDRSYKSLNDHNNLNNNDEINNDFLIKHNSSSSGNLDDSYYEFGIEKFPQVQTLPQVPTVVKGFFIVPLPSIKESPNDYEPEPKKPNNQSIAIYRDYHELTEKNNKNESVQPSKQYKPKPKPQPKKREQDADDAGFFLCCRCNLI